MAAKKKPAKAKRARGKKGRFVKGTKSKRKRKNPKKRAAALAAKRDAHGRFKKGGRGGKKKAKRAAPKKAKKATKVTKKGRHGGGSISYCLKCHRPIAGGAKGMATHSRNKHGQLDFGDWANVKPIFGEFDVPWASPGVEAPPTPKPRPLHPVLARMKAEREARREEEVLAARYAAQFGGGG